MKRWRAYLIPLAGMAVTLAQGCARDVYVPPARPFPLESTWLPPEGATSIQAESNLSTALLGPGVVGGGVRVSRGLTTRLGVSADTSFLHVSGVSKTEHHPNIYATRLGAKLDLDLDYLAVSGGVGGGYAPAAGGFGSIDLGVVSSIENCVLVPFGSGRVFASIPLWAEPIEVPVPSTAPGDAGRTMTRTYAIENTFGLSLASGLKIPLDRKCESRAGLLLGVGVTLLGDGDNGEIFTNAGMAVEVTLF